MFHADRQTDMALLILAFRNVAHAPKKANVARLTLPRKEIRSFKTQVNARADQLSRRKATPRTLLYEPQCRKRPVVLNQRQSQETCTLHSPLSDITLKQTSGIQMIRDTVYLRFGSCLTENTLPLLRTPTGIYLRLWSRVLAKKPTGLQLLKKFREFYGTRKFNTAFTTAHHVS